MTTQRTILTVWRVLIRLNTDAHLVSQVPVLYRKSWNRGMLNASIVAPGRATLALTGWSDVPEFPARGVRIAVTQALALAGREDITVESLRSTDGMHYSARSKA